MSASRASAVFVVDAAFNLRLEARIELDNWVKVDLSRLGPLPMESYLRLDESLAGF